jgi:hypothetical protein
MATPPAPPVPRPDTPPAAFDLTEAAARARGDARQARAENTRRSTAIAWTDFCQWCAARGLLALPAAPDTVGLYLADQVGPPAA